MISKWAYILIGDDMTGKTHFQKYLILHLCGVDKFNRLYTNLVHQVSHRNAPRKLKTLFTINRSIQEKMDDYISVDNYFERFFQDADVAVLSSHSHDSSIDHVRQMMGHLNRRYYNVCAVFFSNHLNAATADIAQLNWNEKLMINNPVGENWEQQINDGAYYFTEAIIAKAAQY